MLLLNRFSVKPQLLTKALAGVMLMGLIQGCENPNELVFLEDQDVLLRTLAPDASWKIVTMVTGETDQTDYWNEYQLVFFSSGEVLLEGASGAYEGTWQLIEEDSRDIEGSAVRTSYLKLYFKPGELSVISRKWTVRYLASHRISLVSGLNNLIEDRLLPDVLEMQAEE